MSDWRQPDEDEDEDDDDEDELIHYRAAWEKRREERWRMTSDRTGQTGSFLFKLKILVNLITLCLNSEQNKNRKISARFYLIVYQKTAGRKHKQCLQVKDDFTIKENGFIFLSSKKNDLTSSKLYFLLET